jgi:hypothetical protein
MPNRTVTNSSESFFEKLLLQKVFLTLDNREYIEVDSFKSSCEQQCGGLGLYLRLKLSSIVQKSSRYSAERRGRYVFTASSRKFEEKQKAIVKL